MLLSVFGFRGLGFGIQLVFHGCLCKGSSSDSGGFLQDCRLSPVAVFRPWISSPPASPLSLRPAYPSAVSEGMFCVFVSGFMGLGFRTPGRERERARDLESLRLFACAGRHAESTRVSVGSCQCIEDQGLRILTGIPEKSVAENPRKCSSQLGVSGPNCLAGPSASCESRNPKARNPPKCPSLHGLGFRVRTEPKP